MSFDVHETEEKTVRFFRKTISFIKTMVRSTLETIENYIRRRTKHLPEHMPMRRNEVIEAIFEQPRYQEFLHQFAQESGINIQHVEDTFRKYLREIAADLNYMTVPFWDSLLRWVFETIYEGLEIDEASLEKVRPLMQKYPVVFVPNHRSHIDYLLLSYVFYNQRMPMPHICAGVNLSFWPLGPVFRKSGAFFIRRSYEGNKLYRNAIQAYMEQLVRNRECMEFFIEGTRSRTGKLLSPRLGVLSALVQSYWNGAAGHENGDVYFVPTAVTYESILEEQGYADERFGASKKDESFWDLLKLRKHLKKKKGKVYVRWGEPISLKAFFDGGKSGADDDGVAKKEKIRQLAFDITYGINKSTVVTPSSLTAAALLTHTGRAIEEKDLQKKISRYLDYLQSKNCPLSDVLKKYPERSIQEALKTYANDRLLESYRPGSLEDGGTLFHISEGKHALLDYYKNSSIHFFVSVGVLATILRTIAREGQPVSLREIEEDYAFLQDLFQYEFTFSRRQSLQTHLEKLLQYLEKKEWLRLDPEKASVTLLPGSLEQLHLYSDPIHAFFESYYTLWKTLPLLGQRRWESKELLLFLRQRGRILYLKDEVQHLESINKFTYQNALFIFRDLGFLTETKEGLGKKKRTYYTCRGDGALVGQKIEEFLKASQRPDYK